MSFQRISKKTNVGTKKKRTKKQPAWDDTVSDLTVHKMSPDEQIRRKQVHRSSNLEAVRSEKVAKTLRRARTNSLDDSKSAFLREVLYDQAQLSDVIAHSDRVMSVVKDLFADDPRRREAIPNVTLAPQISNTHERLQGPVFVRPHTDSQLTTLSESVMNAYALNEVTSSSQDSTLEHLSSDEEKENIPKDFPGKVVDMDRFQRFIKSQQKNASQPDVQILPERGPRSKIIFDIGNIRKKSGGIKTPEPGDVSVDLTGETLAINDTTKVKKKSQSRIDQELANQKAAQNDANDLTKVMQGLQQDISTYEEQSGRRSSQISSGDMDNNSGVGYTATLLNTIRRLVGYLTQSDLQLQEERNHRILLQEQLHHQQSLIDVLTVDVMNIKDQFMNLNINDGTHQQANLHDPILATPYEHVQEGSHQQSPVPHKTQVKAQDTHEKPLNIHDGNGPDNTEEAISSSTLPSKPPPTDVIHGWTPEWSQNIEAATLPGGRSLKDLMYVGRLSHVQPASTALLLSPPRQKDRSMLSHPQGIKHPHRNLRDERLEMSKIDFKPPQTASDLLYDRSLPLQGIGINDTSHGTKLTSSVYQSGRESPPSGKDAPTNLNSVVQDNHPQTASATQDIIYDHGVFPILQTSLAPASNVSDAQLDITRRMQALSHQHAQAKLRLAQLQTESLVLSPAVSPIPFQVESQQPHSTAEGNQGQRITVSLPRVEELEISATSTPSPKSNLSELKKRQSSSRGNAGKFSSKQRIPTTIHQGSTPLADSRKKGTDEGFFALTAHVGS
ncbi:spindle and centriole-associated protein 1-like isoform X2 [Anneissia japonica]|uniref:spindle and centriole-associated protein 1-like isoform X2 n=1 Tax=Anneissia japonica TaxID=1529436 RepID=UPI0014257DF8|nr:spindle and centriole-associated protein 1-like isoform X2 [Anneissia japonica]